MPNALDHVDAPAGWVDALLRAEADIEAGRTVPLLPILEAMRAEAEQMERDLGIEPDEPQAARRPASGR